MRYLGSNLKREGRIYVIRWLDVRYGISVPKNLPKATQI